MEALDEYKISCLVHEIFTTILLGVAGVDDWLRRTGLDRIQLVKQFAEVMTLLVGHGEALYEVFAVVESLSGQSGLPERLATRAKAVREVVYGVMVRAMAACRETFEDEDDGEDGGEEDGGEEDGGEEDSEEEDGGEEDSEEDSEEDLCRDCERKLNSAEAAVLCQLALVVSTLDKLRDGVI
jgi:hypothetical protein